jgi:hypothetical protein
VELLPRDGERAELRTAPVEIGLHLAAELVTAALLVAGGVGAWMRAPWGTPLATFALGMVAYTEIQSPGYFAARGVWPVLRHVRAAARGDRGGGGQARAREGLKPWTPGRERGPDGHRERQVGARGEGRAEGDAARGVRREAAAGRRRLKSLGSSWEDRLKPSLSSGGARWSGQASCQLASAGFLPGSIRIR